MRHPRAVIDLRRPKFANGGAHAIAIEEIDSLPRPGHDVVLRVTQVLDEMTAGKPSGAGYENDVISVVHASGFSLLSSRSGSVLRSWFMVRGGAGCAGGSATQEPRTLNVEVRSEP
jgi:hypothetical protein